MHPTGYQRNASPPASVPRSIGRRRGPAQIAVDSSRPSRAREGDGIRSIARWKGWSIVA
jgi:hypothetical protein